jgi:hypothetical protein
MAPITGQLEGWRDFYLLAGTAAATLMGLLFVALSLRVEILAREHQSHLGALAREAFSSFMIALFLSLLMVSPRVALRPLAVSLGALGLFRLVLLLRRLGGALARGGRDPWFGRRYLLVRFSIPIAAYVTLVIAAVELARHAGEEGLAAVMLATVLLISDGARSAWDLLMRVGRMLEAGPGESPRRR